MALCSHALLRGGLLVLNQGQWAWAGFRRAARTSSNVSSLGSCVIKSCCGQGHAWTRPIGSVGFAGICIELCKSGADHVKARPAGRSQ